MTRAIRDALKAVALSGIILMALAGYANGWEWKAPPDESAGALRERFEKACELYVQSTPGSLRQAEKEFSKLARREKENPYWYESRLLYASCLIKRQEPEKAYKMLEALLKDSPPGKIRRGALEKETEIAEIYLEGMKKKVLGLRIFNARDRAKKILRDVAGEGETGEAGAKAQFLLARAYFEEGNYFESGLAYDSFIRKFPGDERLGRAKLGRVHSRLGAARGEEYDRVPYEESRDELERLIEEGESPEVREEAEKLLDEVRDILAHGEYLTGKFYERSRKPKAAGHSFRHVIDNYPDTEWARKAEKRLEAIESR